MAQFFAGLQPERVWHYFEEITKLPHGSGNEGAVRKYIVAFAEKMGFDYFYKPEASPDAPGDCTVVVYKKAAPGLEQKPTVVLQAHLDMVCVPNDQIFPLKLLFCDGQGRPGIGWVKAGGYTEGDGTSLGADDGIGVAIALAILEEDRYPFGPLEALFTVQEETGLIGARELDPKLLKGRIFINLDEEDLKKITYGCAGGLKSVFHWNINRESVPAAAHCLEIAVSGLKGGHSGMAIHEGGANAIRLLARILSRAAQEKTGFHLAALTGGNLGQSNVIPSRAAATVIFDGAGLPGLETFMAEMSVALKNEYQQGEPGMEIKWQKAELPLEMIDREGTRQLINLLMAIPHGVQKMGADGKAVESCTGQPVETSTNLAAVAVKDGEVTILSKHRSSRESGLDWMGDLHQALADCAGVMLSQSERYPTWTPNEASDLFQKTKKVYDAEFRGEYETLVIHAGLECGWVIEKYRQGSPADCIAIGPTLLEPHTVRERLEIDGVARFYHAVLQILQLYAE